MSTGSFVDAHPNSLTIFRQNFDFTILYVERLHWHA